MSFRRLFACLMVGACGFFLKCGQKEPPAAGPLFLVGGDTVSISMIDLLVPDSLSRPQKLFRAALELSCVKVSARLAAQPSDTHQVNRLGGDLARQLSRLGSEAWSSEAGRTLYIAAQVIAEKARRMNSFSMARAFADSLLSAIIISKDSVLAKEILRKKALSTNPASLEQLLAFLFDLTAESSRVIGEFMNSTDVQPAQAANMSAMVKGLVFDSASRRLNKAPPKTDAKGAIAADNSREALRFRGKNSIKDTIEKHIPNLEALYKKHLKMHQTMEGTVWVTFWISPAGKVMNARIKTSSITEKDFLMPFRDYVMQKIRFQSIPEKAGMMSVEFPFEFTPTN